MITAQEAKEKADLSNSHIEKLVERFDTYINNAAEDGKYEFNTEIMSDLSFTTDQYASLNKEQQHKLTIMKKVAEKLKKFRFSAEVLKENRMSTGGFRSMNEDDEAKPYIQHFIRVSWR